MSNIREYLKEILNGRNTPKDIANDVDKMFEDIQFQLETISEMEIINFNIRKKVHRIISDLRKLGAEVDKDIRNSNS